MNQEALKQTSEELSPDIKKSEQRPKQRLLLNNWETIRVGLQRMPN